MSEADGYPEFGDEFLRNLLSYPNPDGRVCVVRAAELSGVTHSMVYKARARSPRFRREWDKTVLLCLQNHLSRSGR